MNSITVKDFLNTVFPADLLAAGTAPVVAWPDSFVSHKTGERVDFYRQIHYNPRRLRLPHGAATYYCVSTVERQRRRQVRKRLEDVRHAMVLVLDDIGTKAFPPPVAPSYKLETSLGNFQWGYLIEPYDVSTPRGRQYFDSVLLSLAEADMNDPGCRSASRIVRLPGSRHKSGWEAQVTYWKPDRVWDLPDLFVEFGVPFVEARRSAVLKPGKYTRLEDVVDPVYHWLADHWAVYGHNDEWVYIECPWRDTHTDGQQGASSTAYSPTDYGHEGAGFKCLHGHCNKRSADDFMAWILQQRNNLT